MRVTILILTSLFAIASLAVPVAAFAIARADVQTNVQTDVQAAASAGAPTT